ncbi:MAG: hypothetical protein ACYC61_14320 [Isosphaeraceae bacterium]
MIVDLNLSSAEKVEFRVDREPAHLLMGQPGRADRPPYHNTKLDRFPQSDFPETWTAG